MNPTDVNINADPLRSTRAFPRTGAEHPSFRLQHSCRPCHCSCAASFPACSCTIPSLVTTNLKQGVPPLIFLLLLPRCVGPCSCGAASGGRMVPRWAGATEQDGRMGSRGRGSGAERAWVGRCQTFMCAKKLFVHGCAARIDRQGVACKKKHEAVGGFRCKFCIHRWIPIPRPKRNACTQALIAY
jgi:hypothetical protein